MYRFIFIWIIVMSLTACSDSKKRLFTLTCSSPTTCTHTANTYLVSIDGLFVELRPDFVEQCLTPETNNSAANIYCKEMIAPGDSETFTASEDVIKYLRENGFNPIDSDMKRRMKIAEDKIYDSIH